MVKIFLSYSHKDEECRKLLEIHLDSLKRIGLVESWHDRRIEAGSKFEGEISANLESSDIILLLISPFFIASDYCYDIEMRRALARNEAKEAVVIPVILEFCNWQPLPFGNLRATPTDGKPISSFPNHHEAYKQVADDIERVARRINAEPTATKHAGDAVPSKNLETLFSEENRSSNLRVKRIYTEYEKDSYLNEAFEYMTKFFDNSLSELEKRNAGIDCNFKRIDSAHFHATIYRNGKAINSCRIWLGSLGASRNSIFYGYGVTSDNSFNAYLDVDDNGYSLYLKLGMSLGFRNNSQNELTPQGASEYFWSQLIFPLQV
jgi:hypothetical protein